MHDPFVRSVHCKALIINTNYLSIYETNLMVKFNSFFSGYILLLRPTCHSDAGVLSASPPHLSFRRRRNLLIGTIKFFLALSFSCYQVFSLEVKRTVVVCVCVCVSSRPTLVIPTHASCPLPPPRPTCHFDEGEIF